MEASINIGGFWEFMIFLPFAIGNIPLAVARRVPGGSGQTDTDSYSPSLYNSSTVYGHRGSAGTLGVLTAAAFVIPAGVVSVIYLIYVHNCQKSNDNEEGNDSCDSLDWVDSEEEDVMATDRYYTYRTGGLAMDDSDEEISISLLGSDQESSNTDPLEKLSLIHSLACDESFTSNGLDMITPEPGTLVKAGNVNDTNVTTVSDDERWLDDNEGLVNTVEVHVAYGNSTWASRATTPAICGGYKSSTNTRDGVLGTNKHSNANNSTPKVLFKQAVNMRVVNEVQVELKLTTEKENDCLDNISLGTDGRETFMSEVQMFLPGPPICPHHGVEKETVANVSKMNGNRDAVGL